MAINQLSLIYFISSIFTIILAYYAWKRRSNQSVFPLAILLTALSIWSFGYGLEIALTSLPHMKLANAFQYIGIAICPTLYFIFAARYTGNDHLFKVSNAPLLFLMPLITLIMVFTNNLHFLYYSSVEIGTLNSFSNLALAPGPFWWVHIFYSYILLLAGLLLFVRMFFYVSRDNKMPLLFFILGSLLPFIANFIDVIGLKPYGIIELTPIAFILTGTLIFIGLFTTRLFEITPIALELLFENNSDPVILLNMEGKVVSLNPAASELWEKGNRGRLLHEELIANKTDQQDFTIGDAIYSSKKSKIISSGGTALGTMIVMRDITEAKQYEAELIKLSLHDQLTGIYNRHYFMNELKRLENSRDYPVAIIATDLDNLKLVNDTMGHSEGDSHLKTAAKLLSDSIRGSDVLARVGGDEFAILLPRTDLQAGESLINRINYIIESYKLENSQSTLSISIGLAVSNNKEEPLEETYRKADEMMYRDKIKRRNCS